MTIAAQDIWPYHPELLATPVPRYTSYPTAADFHPLDARPLRHAIETASGDVSLYLHIPFCEKICYYCGCNTAASGKRHRLETYLAAIHNEIATVADLLPGDAMIRRVAFGGGSPNAIQPGEFLTLIEALDARFNLAEAVFSIELDPRTMTAQWASAIEAAGITRASMGVQTFAPHCQIAIGREQSDDLIAQSVDWLRDAGITSMNFDLMYGLPEQRHEDLLESLEQTRRMGADRIALFGYAHVPHIVPRQQVIDARNLPDQATRFAMAAAGYRFLTDHGYHPVGFDHFARPDDPLAMAGKNGALQRNFQGFTDDQSDCLIGMGSSAISSFPQLLAQNEKNSGRYRMIASQGLLSPTHGVVRTADDQMRGRVIEHLLCLGKAELSPCLLLGMQGALQPFLERGLARLDALTLTIAAEGLPYARTIAAIVDSYRAQTSRTFSSAV